MYFFRRKKLETRPQHIEQPYSFVKDGTTFATPQFTYAQQSPSTSVFTFSQAESTLSNY